MASKFVKNETDTAEGVMIEQQPLAPVPSSEGAIERDYKNLVQLMEEAMMQRDSERTNVVVSGLVQHIVSSWREQFCKSVITKWNCYFMLPFVDEFHRFIRKELQVLYDGEGENLSWKKDSLCEFTPKLTFSNNAREGDEKSMVVSSIHIHSSNPAPFQSSGLAHERPQRKRY